MGDNYMQPNQPNQPKLLTYGRELITRYNLHASRHEFTFDNTIELADIYEFVSLNIAHLVNLDMTTVTAIDVVHKTFGPDETITNIKWHIDDCIVTKMKTPPTYNTNCYIHLNDKNYLYFNNKYAKLPKYTAVLYYSTQDEDFTGGDFVFADGVKVSPRRGYGIVLDSREVHSVLPVKSGIRRSTIIKIY